MAEIQEFVSPKADKQIKQLLKDADLLAKSYETIAKNARVLDQQISKVSKSTADNAANRKKLTAIEKEEQRIITQTEKVRAQLVKVQSDGNKVLLQERSRLQEVNKQLRQEAKEATGLVGAYQRLNKRRSDARDNLRNLIASQKASTKEIESAQRAFDQLDAQVRKADDAVRDHTKNVGNYEESIRDALSGTEAFSGGTTNVLTNFVELSQQQGGIRAFWSTFVQGIGNATKASLRFIATPIGAVITAIVAAIAALTAIIKRNEGASNRFNEIWEAGAAIMDIVIDRILNLAKALFEFTRGNFGKAAELAAGAFDDLGGALQRAGERAIQISRLTREVTRLNRTTETTLAQLEGQQRLQQIIADDATRSFAERETAAERERQLNAQISSEQLILAQKRLELENLRIKQALEAGKINEELRQGQADALNELIRAENEALAVQQENEKTRRELVQDRLERDLDILIDGFDNIKTINDRIIDDDKRTLEERTNTLNQLTQLANDSFNSQIETIKQFTQVAFNENELLAAQDARILNERIRALGLSEIIEGRLLEIVRERRIVLSEIADQERNLNKETTRALAEESLQRIQDQIAADEQLLTLEEQLILEELDAKKALADELVEVNKLRNKKLEDDDKESAAKRDEIIQNSINLASQLFQGFTNLRVQQISDELNALNAQRQAALAGVEGDKNKEDQINAAFDRKQAVLRQKQLRAEQQGALFEIALQTGINIAKAFPNPVLIALAVALGAAQTAFVRAQKVPQFSKGTGINGLSKDTYGEYGEKGRELVMIPGQNPFIADKPTRSLLPKGTIIKSNPETEKILTYAQVKSAQQGDIAVMQVDMRNELGRVAKNQEKLIRAFKDRPVHMTTFDEKGIRKRLIGPRGTITYLDNRFK